MTPIELKQNLEWASARLLATPSEKIKPADLKVVWPEYSQDKFEVLEFRKAGIALRALAPSSDEIPIMDSILYLPNSISSQTKRRIVRLRSLINPVTNRHVYRWDEIAEELKTREYTIRQYTTKRFFEEGLDEVLRKADPGLYTRLVPT